MTITEIKSCINSDKYSFLKDNEHLGENICLLTIGGSHAYGTNVENSDLDIRGVTVERKNEVIGFDNFDSFRCNQTDTEIHALRRMMSLLNNGNPNIIEMLGNLPEYYLYTDDIGKEIILNKNEFLSEKCIKAFEGYALSNLKRLQNYLSRNLSQSIMEENTLIRCEQALSSFNERYTDFEENSIKLFLDDSTKDNLSVEIFCDVNLKHYPLRDFKNITSELNQIIKSHNDLNKRNNKKTIEALNKHIMHLFRLLLTGIDLLENGEIITYREKDHDFLMKLRNGFYIVYNDENSLGNYDTIFDLLNQIQKKYNYSKLHSVLPKKPNREVMMDILSMAYRRYI